MPLVLLKANRCWQAWTILLPLAMVLIVLRILTHVSGGSSASAEIFDAFIITLLTAWTVVWLVAPELSHRHWLLTSLSAFGVMLATGLLSYLCTFGVIIASSLSTLLVCYTIPALALLIAMALSSRCCRKTCQPWRFMAWLVLWIVLVLTAAMSTLAVGVALYLAAAVNPSNLTHVLGQLPIVALMGVIWGVVLYLINLPFMLLAFGSPFYRQRFCSVLGLKEKEADECVLSTVPRPSTAET